MEAIRFKPSFKAQLVWKSAPKIHICSPIAYKKYLFIYFFTNLL